MEPEFEWDDDKAAENHSKHRVRFTAAKLVFDDPFAIERVDERFDYGEERFNMLGMVGDRLLSVVYSMSNERIRIISARGAEPHEKRRYHEENR
jgi:hypothetical protein